ncbi:MAG: FAD-binding dehydrogenase [Bacteroidetes bacterium]|nr:MAG: FAD-binding dehydrogenase [Bacteroidota bacterium]
MKTDVIIIGGGLAGMVCALELLDRNLNVVLLDRRDEKSLGGLARWAMGGLFYVDSPFQRKAKIKDSPELALSDWLSYAEFEPGDDLPRAWAEQYVHRCTEEVYEWLKPKGVKYVPSVQWLERGLEQRGNSVPRFHVVWGAGHGLVQALKKNLYQHPRFGQLKMLFQHKATELIRSNGRVSGVQVLNELQNEAFELEASAVIIAAGGITGDVEVVKRNWYAPWGKAPEDLLSGSHLQANGEIHGVAQRAGAHITHLDKQWNYAAGVHHPDAEHGRHGLSVIPPKSALWLNWRGERIGPRPLVAGYDTRYLVERICQEEKTYTWQVLNRKIALKELAVSGSAYNDALREQRTLAFIGNLLFGNRSLLDTLSTRCPDVLMAHSVEELSGKMNALTGDAAVDAARLRATLESWDREVAKGDASSDEQMQLLARLREYSGDRMRMAGPQPILDPDAGPLIAIREFILTRKSLGGIQTDLQSRVLQPDGQPIAGLFAVGEAAGFGGGGIHGRRALEGTFLGNCVFTSRIAVKSLT